MNLERYLNFLEIVSEIKSALERAKKPQKFNAFHNFIQVSYRDILMNNL